MKYLVDTNVLSEMRRGPQGNAGVYAWATSVSQFDLAVSVITIKEIERGILGHWRRDKAQSMVYRAWLDHIIIPGYADRVLDVDIAIAQCAAALDVPDPRPVADGLLAATALVHGLTLVTRNTVDFVPTGVRLLNPFT